jgi:excisionase family DNA binding protein
MTNTQNGIVMIPYNLLEVFQEMSNKLERLNAIILKNTEEEEEWLSGSEARKMLGISQKTWQTYRDRKYIPFSQYGRKIRVKKSDVEAYLMSHYIDKQA